MSRSPLLISIIALITGSAVSALQPLWAEDLKGPITEAEGTTALPDKDKADMAGLGAPGADAVMTQDMLLISPSSGQPGKQTQPLTAYIGMTLKIDVNRKEIKFEDLHGLEITVVNDTNRPLVIDGDSSIAKLGDKSYKSAPLTALQLAVNPEHGVGRVVHDAVFIVAPAAATVGAEPTISDLYKFAARPTMARYGKDEERRLVESSRFGKRILWPHEKTQGIVYFETKDVLDSAKVEIPVSTLFDKKDAGILVSSP